MLNLKENNQTVIIEDESSSLYSNSPDFENRHKVNERQFKLGEPGSTSAYRIKCGEFQPVSSCLIYASGGPTRVHSNSALLHEDKCILAISSFIVAFKLPDLDLLWYTEVDSASCFGIYHLPSYESYLSHGELEIARISYNGEILWSSGGKDILTNGFTLYEKYVEVVDWNNETYHIDLKTGQSAIVKAE